MQFTRLEVYNLREDGELILIASIDNVNIYFRHKEVDAFQGTQRVANCLLWDDDFGEMDSHKYTITCELKHPRKFTEIGEWRMIR